MTCSFRDFLSSILAIYQLLYQFIYRPWVCIYTVPSLSFTHKVFKKWAVNHTPLSLSIQVILGGCLYESWAGMLSKRDEFGLMCLHEKISSCVPRPFCTFYIPQNNCDIVLTIFGYLEIALSSGNQASLLASVYIKKISSRSRDLAFSKQGLANQASLFVHMNMQ